MIELSMDEVSAILNDELQYGQHGHFLERLFLAWNTADPGNKGLMLDLMRKIIAKYSLHRWQQNAKCPKCQRKFVPYKDNCILLKGSGKPGCPDCDVELVPDTDNPVCGECKTGEDIQAYHGQVEM